MRRCNALQGLPKYDWLQLKIQNVPFLFSIFSIVFVCFHGFLFRSGLFDAGALHLAMQLLQLYRSTETRSCRCGGCLGWPLVLKMCKLWTWKAHRYLLLNSHSFGKSLTISSRKTDYNQRPYSIACVKSSESKLVKGHGTWVRVFTHGEPLPCSHQMDGISCIISKCPVLGTLRIETSCHAEKESPPSY